MDSTKCVLNEERFDSIVDNQLVINNNLNGLICTLGTKIDHILGTEPCNSADEVEPEEPSVWLDKVIYKQKDTAKKLNYLSEIIERL